MINKCITFKDINVTRWKSMCKKKIHKILGRCYKFAWIRIRIQIFSRIRIRIQWIRIRNTGSGALYFCRHFIMVDIFCANQSEAKFLCLPLKSCQNDYQEINQITLSRENMKLLRPIFFFSLVKFINWFPWEKNLHKKFLPKWNAD